MHFIILVFGFYQRLLFALQSFTVLICDILSPDI